jgi:hypothetical protein
MAHTPEQIAEFSDSGDVFVEHNDGSEIRLEVKSIKREWTSIADHPFRDHITAERVVTWEAKAECGELPAAIILVSKVTGVPLIIPCSTRQYWRREMTTDKERKWRQPYFYTTSHSVIDWDHFIWWLATVTKI